MEKIFSARNIVGMVMFIVTGILAAVTIYFDAFTPYFRGFPTSDDYVIEIVIAVTFSWFGMFLFPVFVIIGDYIGEKYGKKQHLLNVGWLILCCTFAYFAVCFPNVLIKIGQLSAISEVSLHLYRLVIVFVTLFLLCWLCHLVDYYKHIVEYSKTPMRKSSDENIVSAD